MARMAGCVPDPGARRPRSACPGRLSVCKTEDAAATNKLKNGSQGFNLKQKNGTEDARVALSVKRLILGLGSGPDLGVMGSSCGARWGGAPRAEGGCLRVPLPSPPSLSV